MSKGRISAAVALGLLVAAPPAAGQLAPDTGWADPREASAPAEDVEAEGGGSGTGEAAVDWRADGAVAALGSALLWSAARHLGERYVMGGTAPGEGFDCSGFVRHVFAQVGIGLPRTSREQARVGAGVRRPRRTAWDAVLRPGDLLFFATTRRKRRIDHVAIYAGPGRIVHATAWGRAVREEELDSQRGRWLLRHLVEVRRVLGAVAPTDWTAPDLGSALAAMAMPAGVLAVTGTRGGPMLCCSQ